MKSSWERNRAAILKRLFLFIFVVAPPQQLFANDSPQPYIDQLKKEISEKSRESGETVTPEPETGEPDPYLQSIKKKLETTAPSPPLEESYTARIKAKELTKPEVPPESIDSVEPFISQEKSKLEPREEGGAIQAFHEGRSELQPKKVGKIRHAFGIRYADGNLLTRSFTSSSQLRGFNEVYGSTYSPDITLFYEFQPFHSEVFGNIGIVSMLGLAYFQGRGQFAVALPIPGGGGTLFPTKSDTKFQFFEVPVTVGINYRLNVLRYVRPFVFAGPTAIGFAEMRNDPIEGSRGACFGMLFSGGVSILLDWVSPGSAWALYSGLGIQHYYLTAEYSQLATFAGNVNFSVSGFTAGLTFEY